MSDQENLEAKIGVMAELTKLGRSTICNRWMKEWADSSLDKGNLDHKDIYVANLFLFSHSVELLTAIGVSLGMSINMPGFGLVGPGYTLLRSQLECYWSLSFLLMDASLIKQNCTAFMYCYSMIHHKANLYFVEIEDDITDQDRDRARKRHKQEKDRILDTKHYKATADAYDAASKGSKHPDWYMLFHNDVLNRRMNNFRDLAEVVGQKAIYNGVYHYWSAVSHGFAPPMPPLRINMSGASSQSSNDWVEMTKDVGAMEDVAANAINQACDTYTLFVEAILTSHGSDLHDSLVELAALVPDIKLRCLKRRAV